VSQGFLWSDIIYKESELIWIGGLVSKSRADNSSSSLTHGEDTYVFFHGLQDKGLQFVEAVINASPTTFLHNRFVCLKKKEREKRLVNCRNLKEINWKFNEMFVQHFIFGFVCPDFSIQNIWYL